MNWLGYETRRNLRRDPLSTFMREFRAQVMVLDEALRLYPPAWSTTRSPLDDDEVLGRRLPKGKFAILSPYVTHRHPDFWEAPDVFNPRRFENGVTRGGAKFSYMPFGGGPRQCLGLGFALT